MGGFIVHRTGTVIENRRVLYPTKSGIGIKSIVLVVPPYSTLFAYWYGTEDN